MNLGRISEFVKSEMNDDKPQLTKCRTNRASIKGVKGETFAQVNQIINSARRESMKEMPHLVAYRAQSDHPSLAVSYQPPFHFFTLIIL